MDRESENFWVIVGAIAVWALLLFTSAGRQVLDAMLGFYENWAP